jgi:hypothetical protein
MLLQPESSEELFYAISYKQPFLFSAAAAAVIAAAVA